jgi:hypothetical protein
MDDDAAVAAFRGGSPKRSLRRAAVALALLSIGFLVGRLTASGPQSAAVSATARPPAVETALAPAAAVAVTPPSLPMAASDLATARPTAAASDLATTTPTAPAEPPAATASGSQVSVPPTEAVAPPRKLPAHTGQSTGSAGVMRGAGRAQVDAKQEAIALPSSVPPPPVDAIVQAVQEGMNERHGRGE